MSLLKDLCLLQMTLSPPPPRCRPQRTQAMPRHTLDNNRSDQPQFAPFLDAIKSNLGSNPDEVSADGYCSAANLRTLSRQRIKGYIATGRQTHGSKSATAKQPAKPGSLLARMTTQLRRRLSQPLSVAQASGRAGVRPDQAGEGFRQFLLRGIEKLKPEWALICTAHNLTELARAA